MATKTKGTEPQICIKLTSKEYYRDESRKRANPNGKRACPPSWPPRVYLIRRYHLSRGPASKRFRESPTVRDRTFAAAIDSHPPRRGTIRSCRRIAVSDCRSA